MPELGLTPNVTDTLGSISPCLAPKNTLGGIIEKCGGSGVWGWAAAPLFSPHTSLGKGRRPPPLHRTGKKRDPDSPRPFASLHPPFFFFFLHPVGVNALCAVRRINKNKYVDVPRFPLRTCNARGVRPFPLSLQEQRGCANNSQFSILLGKCCFLPPLLPVALNLQLILKGHPYFQIMKSAFRKPVVPKDGCNGVAAMHCSAAVTDVF